MRKRLAIVPLLAALVFLNGTTAGAADVCLRIDESRDTFSPGERTAALLLLTRQFELAGQRVVTVGCAQPYVVSHVQLGTTIVITLTGPAGQRDATAHGMDDVPAVYSQMVRSLLSGQPMNAPGIVDRTNVTRQQADAPRRVYSDSIAYARLGYGGIVGDRVYGGPSVGVFGYRREFDAFGIDVSFLNILYKSSRASTGLYGGNGGMTGSWIKIAFLRFLTPSAAQSNYFGAGLSWSGANLDNGNRSSDGSGLQGELIAGRELGRASTIRVFVQLDAGLPFYRLQSIDYTFLPTYPYTISSTTAHQYAPSFALSLGVGWQRGGGGR
jgi:hypothetical protein